MVRHEWRQVCSDTNRPHARATATVWNSKGFVQVHVRNVGADKRWLSDTDLRVQVSAIHIHLTTVLVDQVTDFFHAFLIDTMSRRVGQHQTRQLIRQLFGFLFQIIKINVTLLITLSDDNTHRRHLC